MKSSNLAFRLEREDPAEIACAPAPEPGLRNRVETRAAERRARTQASFEYRAILIRDQGLRPFRVR